MCSECGGYSEYNRTMFGIQLHVNCVCGVPFSPRLVRLRFEWDADFSIFLIAFVYRIMYVHFVSVRYWSEVL